MKKTYTPFKLTIREWQVFVGLATDKSIREIAAALKLSPKTVGTYRDRVKAKTGLKSHVSMALYYRNHKSDMEKEENG